MLSNQKASGYHISSQLANLPSKGAKGAMMMFLNVQGVKEVIRRVTKPSPLMNISTKSKQLSELRLALEKIKVVFQPTLDLELILMNGLVAYDINKHPK